jgi:hypothetical protein
MDNICKTPGYMNLAERFNELIRTTLWAERREWWTVVLADFNKGFDRRWKCFVNSSGARRMVVNWNAFDKRFRLRSAWQLELMKSNCQFERVENLYHKT